MTGDLKNAIRELVDYVGTPEECADCESSIDADGMPCGLHAVVLDVVTAAREEG